MTRNMGSADRMIRAVVGVALLLAAFTSMGGVTAWIFGIFGVMMLGSSALGVCPPYSLMGITTCKAKT